MLPVFTLHSIMLVHYTCLLTTVLKKVEHTSRQHSHTKVIVLDPLLTPSSLCISSATWHLDT